MIYSSILPINQLSLTNALYSGQCFIWNYYNNEQQFHAGLIDNYPVFISADTDGQVEVFCESSCLYGKPLNEYFSDYFSLDIEASDAFPESFTLNYPLLWKQLGNYLPMRVLRQDPFETLITFMCAQGIGMRIIRRQVSLIAQTFGRRFDVMFRDCPVTMYGFPSPSRLAGCDPEELTPCTNNNRVRARNIVLASKAVAEGKIDFNELRNSSLLLSDVRKKLCGLTGIGLKIADCIALFGLGRFDAFPIDTHVKQYLAFWFSSATARRPLTPSSYLALDAEARSILNPDLAGYAGHILFHCWRKEIKNLRWF
jgi:N-glycosylase/DNA lyase